MRSTRQRKAFPVSARHEFILTAVGSRWNSEEVARFSLVVKNATSGDPEAAGVIQSTIESFAQELAVVIRRFLKLKEWGRGAPRDRRRV